MTKLRLLEESMTKYFEALSPPSWIQRIVDNIFDNMSITFAKVTLNLKYFSSVEYETILKI